MSTEHQPLLIRPFQPPDLEAACQLSRSEGWNQTSQYWQSLLDHEPRGCFVAVQGSRVVGTVTTTCYQRQLAWIGMMLVDPSARRQGIGTRLMQRALDYLQDERVTCIKLDATPVGFPVYRRLGFQSEWVFQRWQRDSNARLVPVVPRPEAVTCAELDHQAFGADRRTWLQRLAEVSVVEVRPQGFGMLRSGRRAHYLGPVVASDEDVAQEIVNTLLADCRGPVFWDVPGTNELATRLVRQLGFEPVRDLTRMWLGPLHQAPNAAVQFAIGDPATG